MILCFFYEPSLTETILNKVWICFIISVVLYLLKFYWSKAKNIKIFLESFILSILFSLITYAISVNIISPLLYEKSSILYFFASFPLVLSPLIGAIYGLSRKTTLNNLQKGFIALLIICYLFLYIDNFQYYYENDLIKTSSKRKFQEYVWRDKKFSILKYQMLDDFHKRYMEKNQTSTRTVEVLLGKPDKIDFYYEELDLTLSPDSIDKLIYESKQKELEKKEIGKTYNYYLFLNNMKFNSDTITLKIDFINDTVQLSHCQWKYWINFGNEIEY